MYDDKLRKKSCRCPVTPRIVPQKSKLHATIGPRIICQQQSLGPSKFLALANGLKLLNQADEIETAERPYPTLKEVPTQLKATGVPTAHKLTTKTVTL